ncbi:hypothetical protein ACWD0A_33040 [Streptomyces sp. NPDC002867]
MSGFLRGDRKTGGDSITASSDSRNEEGSHPVDALDRGEEDPNRAAARERQIWLNSRERKKAVLWAPLIVVALIPFFASLGGLISVALDEDAFLGAVLGGFMVTYFGIPGLFLYYRQMRRDLRGRILLGQLEELQRDEEASGSDFASLWAHTQKRLNVYHKISTRQAERSFLHAQIAAGAGFIAIVSSALIAGFARTTTASIVSGVTGISGAAMAAYIGATFTKTQERSSAQLKAYFLQPVELLRYLTAERLLDHLHGKARRVGTEWIIKSIASQPKTPPQDE